MTKPQIYPSAQDLQEAAADFIVRSAQEAVSSRGRFTIALSGGSTPEKVYELLGQEPRSALVDWQKVHIFIGDERFAPVDDPRSNYGLAKRCWLDRIHFPAANLHPVATQLATPEEAALDYARQLGDFFGLPVDGPSFPQLDLNLLGLGDDGHTASLFPGKPTVHEKHRWVVSSPAGTLPPPVDRVTLTFPVLNAARIVLMLVAGSKKAEIVGTILEGNPSADEHPAILVKPTQGTLVWMLDRAAAQSLS